ncbi:MAG: hypothetical protein ABI606_05085 [Rhodoferax sp.]
MIALLPLRSWAGDMMTAQMIATSVNQRSVHCPDHAKVQRMDVTSVQDTELDHCSMCIVCKVCQSVTPADETQIPVLRQLHHHMVMPSGTAFTSATAAPGLKPPIS